MPGKFQRTMPNRLKSDWIEFRDAPPGTRFERRYERKHRGGAGLLGRAAGIAAGTGALLRGCVMLFTPGPGLLAMAFGATCFAQESRPLARGCDRLELRLRAAWARWRARRRG